MRRAERKEGGFKERKGKAGCVEWQVTIKSAVHVILTLKAENLFE